MAMDEDTVADLKQFIASLIVQQTADLRQDIRRLDEGLTALNGRVNILDKDLNKKIDDLSAAVAEALDNSNELYSTQLKNYERRIVRLEKKIA